jgi:hypothetical protein
VMRGLKVQGKNPRSSVNIHNNLEALCSRTTFPQSNTFLATSRPFEYTNGELLQDDVRGVPANVKKRSQGGVALLGTINTDCADTADLSPAILCAASSCCTWKPPPRKPRTEQ